MSLTPAISYGVAVSRPPLDPSLYSLSPAAFDFFQQLTGIQDEEEMKRHILDVQARAYAIYGYPCIRRLTFIKMRISRLSGYKEAMKLLKNREKPILLDLGCCFGNDIRKAVMDGWPVECAIASDLRQGFWDSGHELFKSTPHTFPAAFVAGDVFDPNMLSTRGAFVDANDISSVLSRPTPDLNALTSLTPLQGMISAIHASSFFHLFSEEKQLELAHLVASLLSPEKGSVIFGRHVASPQVGLVQQAAQKATWSMFCHEPESWKDLWVDGVFGKDGKGAERVRVKAALVEVKGDLSGDTTSPDRPDAPKFYLMDWCITRL